MEESDHTTPTSGEQGLEQPNHEERPTSMDMIATQVSTTENGRPGAIDGISASSRLLVFLRQASATYDTKTRRFSRRRRPGNE